MTRTPQQGDLVEVCWLDESQRDTWHCLAQSEEQCKPGWDTELYIDGPGHFLGPDGQVYSFDQCPVSGADLVVGHTKLILPACDSMAEAWECADGAGLKADCYPAGDIRNVGAGIAKWRRLETGRLTMTRSGALYFDPDGKIRPTNYDAHMRDMQKFGALCDYLANVRAKEQARAAQRAGGEDAG